MLGFAIGAACLFGLAMTFRRGGGPRHFRRTRSDRFLRHVFRRLDTTAGQEKVIVSAVEALRNEAAKARQGLAGTRGEVATALRSDAFDEVLLGATLGRVEGTVDSMRKASLDAFAAVHGVLDERQRGLLADLVERGAPACGMQHAHPYRL